MGNWWWAASSWWHTRSRITSSAEFFGQNIKSLRWLSPTTAQIWHPGLLTFPKTKITFRREEISHHQWDSGKYDRKKLTIGKWENCGRSQGTYFEEDWGIIVLCTILLVFCNVSIFVRLWKHGWKGLLLLVQCDIVILQVFFFLNAGIFFLFICSLLLFASCPLCITCHFLYCQFENIPEYTIM